MLHERLDVIRIKVKFHEEVGLTQSVSHKSRSSHKVPMLVILKDLKYSTTRNFTVFSSLGLCFLLSSLPSPFCPGLEHHDSINLSVKRELVLHEVLLAGPISLG